MTVEEPKLVKCEWCNLLTYKDVRKCLHCGKFRDGRRGKTLEEYFL
jgi:hypothetical protein